MRTVPLSASGPKQSCMSSGRRASDVMWAPG